MSSLFPNNTPTVEIRAVFINRDYSRQERRQGKFVVRIENEFLRILSRSPFKCDVSHNDPTPFSYKVALETAEQFRDKNPTVYLYEKGKKGEIIIT
ncbi:MAG TPA: hypothetical protein PKU83_04595 [Chryseolinea sp.]|mgnify:CR=1 FL=1|nr:hypothetical protein [Chryseolinea sp.]